MKAFFKSPFFSYLVFIFLACSGALLWQFCFPQLAVYSAWGIAVGWQREIALWNIALIAAILYAFIQGKTNWAKPLISIYYIVLGSWTKSPVCLFSKSSCFLPAPCFGYSGGYVYRWSLGNCIAYKA